MDTSGAVRFINKFGLHFFGYKEEDILGRAISETIFPPGEGCNLDEIIRHIREHPEECSSQITENIRATKERVWIAWTHRLVLNERGEVIEVLCIGNDVTENKRSSEELKRAAAELRETGTIWRTSAMPMPPSSSGIPTSASPASTMPSRG